MKNASITLTKQQRLWLKDLILADINDWQSMAARPVDEIGVLFAHLADTRIANMRTLLIKLYALEAVDTLNKAHASGLVPEIVCKNDFGYLVVSLDSDA